MSTSSRSAPVHARTTPGKRCEILHRHAGSLKRSWRAGATTPTSIAKPRGFRICEQTAKPAAPPGTRRFAYYIDVRDVDALYAELKHQTRYACQGRRLQR